MFYLDENDSLQESNDVQVYRVFGWDVPLEGSYVSDQPASDPINARWYNALSQHDFLDSDGNPIRNMASQIASGHISLDDEGHIIDQNTFKATDNVLEFSEVQPTSDLPGGGTEYQLQGDFNDLVVVDSVEDLRHEPTDGWLDYLEAEKQVLNGTYNPDDPYGGGSGGAVEGVAESVDAAAIDDLIEDTEYDLQATDVEQSWEELIDEHPEDGMDTETAALDGLIDDEEYDLQATDVEQSWEDYLGEYSEDGMDTETAALDGLIDDEEYDLQATDVEQSWEDYLGEYSEDGMDTETAALDDLIDDTEYEIQSEDVEDSWNDDSDDSWDSSDSSSDDDSDY